MSKIDRLKNENPQLNISLIDILASLDPTSTHKYTGFMIKLLKSQLQTDDVKKEIGEILFNDEVIEYLKKFENHCVAQRIKNNDISQYKNLDEIIEAVKIGDEIVKQKEAEKQIVKLYDKDGYLILIPLTFQASKTYGAGTTWCVTQQVYWERYLWKYRLIYIIDKNNNKKYAISISVDDKSDIKGWLSDDTEVSPFVFDIPDDVMLFLMKQLRRPAYEIELGALNEENIFDKNGNMVPISIASRNDIVWFTSKFEYSLSDTFKSRLNIPSTKETNTKIFDFNGYEKYMLSDESNYTFVDNTETQRVLKDLIKMSRNL